MQAPRKTYPFRATPELEGETRHYPVVIAGGGPIGMAAALDLAALGIRSVVLDDDNKVSVGSRAICWSKRSLEIFDRLECVAPMMAKGVVWNTGRLHVGNAREAVFTFDMLPDRQQCFPAFINLQQYYVEEDLVAAMDRTPLTELRWQSRVASVRNETERVVIGVETPDGPYQITADYLIAADGSRSSVRALLGLDFAGEVFLDHFLIADIKMRADFPPERWFWFDPPFARGQSALLHKQPDDVWRLDFQLGWNIDRDKELAEERIRERVTRMIGEVPFELEWASIYTFQCRQLDRFLHGRVLFAGDAAHLVSPFGARGANSGLQDVDNLCWKLALVLRGLVPERLLESYDAERVFGARENLRNSTRSTDFITPKSAMSRAFRDATLELSRDHPALRAFVNSGRLSRPTVLADSPLNTPDGDRFGGPLRPGMTAIDAPVTSDGHSTWFLRTLQGGFTLVVFGAGGTLGDLGVPVALRVLRVLDSGAPAAGAGVVSDAIGKLKADHDATPGSCFLYRPDQHLTARWRSFDAKRVRGALLRALAMEGSA